MSGALSHSPADVVRYMMIDLSLGTIPTAGGSWPINVSVEPDSPDNCITIYDTEGIQSGSEQVGGEVQEHHGFQVRVRSPTHAVGYAKARAIAQALDTLVAYETVTISSNTYRVESVSRRGDVLVLGKDMSNTKRDLFTINYLVSITKLT